jgi:hypothetical protein
VRRSGSILLAALLAVVFAGGVLYLFNREFSGGAAYPAYSTLRGDPAGAKLIFESLGGLQGVTVARSYQPLERLRDRDSTVLLLGLEPYDFAVQPSSELHAAEDLAQRGNRLVFGMEEAVGHAPSGPASLEKVWGVRFGLVFDKEGRGDLFFADAKNWEILELNGTRPVVIERVIGKGSIVLVADGRMFGNEAVADAKQTALLTRIIGVNRRIVFDEAHFGIVESGSVVALARRFRLHGLALGLAIVAILFIWKNASSFPPVASAERSNLNLDQFQAAIERVSGEIRKVIIGQDDAIRYSLVVVLCNQHALIEGVPGLGKTLLARTLAACLGGEFKRIQFTPDLMPADITGTTSSTCSATNSRW